MKNVAKFIIGFLIGLVGRTVYAMFTVVSPTSRVFYVRGRHLYDNNREKVILRGINLPLLDDWDFPRSDKLAELAQTGANAVRIQWYTQYPPPRNPTDPARPAYSLSDLDAFLDKCRLNALIPILELHDWTCQDYTQAVNTQLINWWTRPDVRQVLKRHERYLIINLANELGLYRFRPQAARPTALNNFRDAYKAAITSIRSQGLLMPIMIDAPDCGQSINAFTSSTSNNDFPSIGRRLISRLRDLALLRESAFARLDMPSNVGQELIAHDPRHSLLLSVHSYWAAYDGRPEIDAAVRADLPIVFGEIANKQDERDRLGNIWCFYALDGTSPSLLTELTTRPRFWGVVRKESSTDALILALRQWLGTNNTPPTGFQYQYLLATHLPRYEIGWLAWAWYRDNCADRRMTPDGNFANLTTYGRDIVFNPVYGLLLGAYRAEKTNSLPGAPPPP